MKYIFIIIIILLAGCEGPGENAPGITSDPFVNPQGFPVPVIPEDNPITAGSVELGKKLFYDPILSADSSVACLNCHQQKFAFTDGGSSISKGINGGITLRNSPTLANLIYTDELLWDGTFWGKNALEQVVYRVFNLKNEFHSDSLVIASRLASNPTYNMMFQLNYGQNKKPGIWLASKAIASFLRTLVSCNSKYDRYLRGDGKALNDMEKSGMDIFFSSKTKCSECHSGILFTDNQFHNTGLTTHYFDKGRYLVTDRNEDRGKFRTPTLRNIALTSPYMHNGELFTLKEVLDHYNTGGKPFINKDPRIAPLELTAGEIAELQSFLEALTDEDFITNRKFSK